MNVLECFRRKSAKILLRCKTFFFYSISLFSHGFLRTSVELPIHLQKAYSYRLDSTPEAHKYMLAVARSQHPIKRRASI
jgi:hypothetical protein